MTQVLLSKPSRIHNLGYILLGFYLSSLVTFDLNLLIDQEIAFVTLFGSLLGTFIYYLKPIERTISFYFRISKQNKTYPEEPFDEFRSPVYKSEVLSSSYLQDERAVINGAFFLSLGIITSNRYLESIGLSHLYWELQILTVALICLGVWEIYVLICRRIPILIFFYNYFNISNNIPEMEKAIRAKDWIRAQKIAEKEPELLDPDLLLRPQIVTRRGICLSCKLIVEKDSFCTRCGNTIVTNCSKCDGLLIRDLDEEAPEFCRHCGAKIELVRTT